MHNYIHSSEHTETSKYVNMMKKNFFSILIKKKVKTTNVEVTWKQQQKFSFEISIFKDKSSSRSKLKNKKNDLLLT
ncbi:unnamed protein product [Rhizophagus irregularis]|nr:unnamed protein product [Rhizophagus irregularis]